MSVEEIMAALKTPPKRSVGKIYSLDEIEKDFEVRSLLQAVEVKSVGFDFDKASVKGMEAGYLGNVAAAILKVLEDRPDEVFFVEGHADAPGPYDYNLTLSKQRALHVKNALINVFGIPKKNVIAAGFGEKHLKITTDRPEPANRRVTVRCITPLVKQQNASIQQDASKQQNASRDIVVATTQEKEDAKKLVFNLGLSGPVEQKVLLIYSTEDGTALAGSDYEAKRGSVVLQPGTTNTTVSVTLLDDDLAEGDETFELLVTSDLNLATVKVKRGLATILDNEAQAAKQ